MNWNRITSMFTRRKKPFYRKRRNLGIFATVAAALWGAKVWQGNR